MGRVQGGGSQSGVEGGGSRNGLEGYIKYRKLYMKNGNFVSFLKKRRRLTSEGEGGGENGFRAT